jgi:hypothetical protein
VRAEPDKLKARIVRLAVNQNEVGFGVTVAVIAPLAAEQVIEIPPGQGLVFRQQRHGLQQIGVEALAVPS